MSRSLLLISLFFVAVSFWGCGTGFCNFSFCGGSGDSGGEDGGGGSGNFVTGTGFDNEVLAVAVASDGSGDVYVGGAFDSYNGVGANRLVRLNADGSVDSGFTAQTINGSVSSISMRTDGNLAIYIAGSFTSYGGLSASRILRLQSDGNPDLDFNVGAGPNAAVSRIAVAPNELVYAIGAFTTFVAAQSVGLVRMQSNGARDGGFVVGVGFLLGLPFQMEPNANLSVYVCGSFGGYQAGTHENLIRISPTGAEDAAFAVGGGGGGFDNRALSVAVTVDGSNRVYFGGDFTSFGATGAQRVVRLASDGTLDASFDTNTGGPNLSVQALLPNSTHLYMAGAFTTYVATPVGRIARVDSTAKLDTTFNTGTGFDGEVVALDFAPSGNEIYVVGSFSSYNGTSAPGIIRLNSDGSSD